MRRTQAPYDDKWAIARLREVWEWAVASNRHFVAYLLGMAILAFELDTGDRKFKPSQPRGADLAALREQMKEE
ncbi:MAG: hypothetical protein ABL996_16680 [Micropepsaceae bacterium]